MHITVRTNAREAVRWLEKIRRDQIPFATAKALTFTAKRCRDKARKDTSRRFDKPRRGVDTGIRHRPASKRDWPNSKAIVGSLDEFQVLQEKGGIKRPGGKGRKGTRGSTERLAIPMKRFGRTKLGNLKKANRPRPLISSGKAKIVDDDVRRTKTRRKDRRQRLFILRRRAQIKPARPTMGESIRGEAQRVYKREFLAAYRRAIRSRRP